MAFYDGPIAARLVEDINANGGNFSIDDLRNYRAIVRRWFVDARAWMRACVCVCVRACVCVWVSVCGVSERVSE